jgi:hypothetical protein
VILCEDATIFDVCKTKVIRIGGFSRRIVVLLSMQKMQKGSLIEGFCPIFRKLTNTHGNIVVVLVV